MSESTTATASTGDVRVDAVVARLDTLDDLDLREQLDAFTDMHATLAAVLDGDDSAVETTFA